MGSKTSGFAALNPEQRRAICRRGGIAAHASGRAHKFTTAEATAAGKKGGVHLLIKRGHEYFVELGKRGGAASSVARRPKPIACRRDDAGDEKLQQMEGGVL